MNYKKIYNKSDDTFDLILSDGRSLSKAIGKKITDIEDYTHMTESRAEKGFLPSGVCFIKTADGRVCLFDTVFNKFIMPKWYSGILRIDLPTDLSKYACYDVDPASHKCRIDIVNIDTHKVIASREIFDEQIANDEVNIFTRRLKKAELTNDAYIFISFGNPHTFNKNLYVVDMNLNDVIPDAVFNASHFSYEKNNDVYFVKNSNETYDVYFVKNNNGKYNIAVLDYENKKASVVFDVWGDNIDQDISTIGMVGAYNYFRITYDDVKGYSYYNAKFNEVVFMDNGRQAILKGSPVLVYQHNDDCLVAIKTTNDKNILYMVDTWHSELFYIFDKNKTFDNVYIDRKLGIIKCTNVNGETTENTYSQLTDRGYWKDYSKIIGVNDEMLYCDPSLHYMVFECKDGKYRFLEAGKGKSYVFDSIHFDTNDGLHGYINNEDHLLATKDKVVIYEQEPK